MDQRGILMIFGWWLFIASGILAARYLRTLWQDKKLFHSPIWFNTRLCSPFLTEPYGTEFNRPNLHRGLNATGVLAVAAAFICIFIRSCGEWEDDTDPTYKHSVLGMTASVCAFVQPVFAMVRCHPGTSKRPIFNWAHRIIGFGGLCCACKLHEDTKAGFHRSAAAIWYATFFHYGLHSQDGYGLAPRVLIIIFYCTLIAVVLLFEFLITVCERLSTKFNKISSNGGAQSSTPSNQFRIEMAESKNNAWDYGRVGLLALYMLITAGIGIALACFIGIGRQTSS
uniref:Cytochrome b561 domain-containing protein n=1 Tax=Romanomermis culicivorax TaxID=13658 RepID=A0A915KWY3_ROMCU